MQKSIVYIAAIVVAALLLIAAGVFAFKIQQNKPQKRDLFTGMDQYPNGSRNANSTMSSICSNASLNRSNNLIN